MATVLVVDDDALSREFIRTLLGHRGHQIREASDGDSALALAARQPPDAVITDVLMPGVDGYELARTLRSRPATSRIPIAFSTAHYGPQDIQPLADACGVHDVIFKPAHPTTVLATIDAMLVPGRASTRTSIDPQRLAVAGAPVGVADQLAEIQQLTRSGTWDLDPRSNTIVVSPDLRDLLRLPSTRLRLDELAHRVHPEDAARATAMAECTRRTGEPNVLELRVAGLDGAVHELIVSCRAAPGHRPGHALWGVAQDVTQLRAELRADLRVQADWLAQRRTVDSFHRAMLPWGLPSVAGAGLAAIYLAAPERLDIGAGWYDALPVHGGQIMLSVGRVAGHDRHPAAVMGPILAVLRAYALEDPDPAAVLARLNRFLTDTYHDDTFATAVIAIFGPHTGQLRVANAGHPPPLVISLDRDGDPGAVAVAASGPALGIFAGATFPEQDLYLAPGAAYCAYTDGLTDRHSQPTSTDRQRLPQVAARAFGQLSAADPTHLLAETIVRDMLGGDAPDDDVCLAILRAGDA